MKFNTIENDRTFIKKVEIKNAVVKKEQLGILHSIDSMYLEKELVEFKYTDTYNEIDLEFKRSSNAIVKVLDLKGKIATIKIIIFAMPLENIYEKLYIKLDEKLLEKKLKESDFLITINAKNYIAIASGNYVEDTLFLSQAQKIQNEIEKLKKAIQKNPENKMELEQKICQLKQEKQDIEVDEIAFTILSDSKHLAIKRVDIGENKVIYKATKLMEKTQKEIAGLRLVELKEPFEFKDDSVKANIKEALESGSLTSKYLKIWDKYANEEGNYLLKTAREIGEVEIKDIDGFKLEVDIDLREKLNENDFICIMETTPPYLENKEISFLEYLKEYINKEKLETQNQYIKTYKIENITSKNIVLERQENLRLDDLKGKKFSLSIFGDFTALKRKYKARERILKGESANPILPMIFAEEISEKLKQMLRVQQKSTHPPLSDKVEKKIFKTKPTENQIDAIRMAINAKDIAIIQGPPGTGKTTVLNAIIERLNELNDKDLDKKGSIFISGYQHSAVENLIQRMSLNGIPTPKFGTKSNELESIENYDYILKWSEKIAKNIVVKEDAQNIKELRELTISYHKRPSQSKQKEILQKIMDTSELKLRECRDIAKSMLEEIRIDEFSDLSLIYALRSNALSFEDDGLARNEDLLTSEFRDLLTNEEKQILKNKTFTKDLVKVKNELISRFTPKPQFEKEKPNGKLLDLIGKVIDVLSNLSIESRINVVLAEFKQKLESNPFALKAVLKDYSIAFSATIGQSVSKDILNAKGVKEEDTKQPYSYDTVIVDEAAMISPLDLFLVLVLAKHRIILVGDHRQLPHRINEEILKEVNKEGKNDIEKDLLKESMFSFLKERAEELEKIDSVRRFITLDSQFRTHSSLGNLVSRIFYPYDEQYKSPRPDSDFKHNLKGIENIPAVWINLAKGEESKSGTSRIRKCEIDMIASKLVEYLSSEIKKSEEERLSFGIISFYSAQVNEIKKRIEILKKNHTEIKEELEKVKIGSVDKFQGNEYDIVFLSTVRSKKIRNEGNVSAEAAFGFLAVPNRLCVAMSRQKKCLIAVGDMEYFKSELAQKYVKGLYEFALLCESEGRVL